MKFLFSVLAILIFNKECDQNKSTDATVVAVNSENLSTMAQEDTTIWYEETTRGFYEKIWVTKDSLTVTNDRNQVERISYKTLGTDWNELMELLKEVDLKTVPNLEAPTSMRHYDGARIATFSVIQGKDETKSGSFDHGHPPKAIEALVNKVLSMRGERQKK